jgi:hypothetical protein
VADEAIASMAMKKLSNMTFIQRTKAQKQDENKAAIAKRKRVQEKGL